MAIKVQGETTFYVSTWAANAPSSRGCDFAARPLPVLVLTLQSCMHSAPCSNVLDDGVHATELPTYGACGVQRVPPTLLLLPLHHQAAA